MEGAEASPVAMQRPIQAKANRASPATHAPRLTFLKNKVRTGHPRRPELLRGTGTCASRREKRTANSAHPQAQSEPEKTNSSGRDPRAQEAANVDGPHFALSILDVHSNLRNRWWRDQCGLNVFPVSSSVFRRERIRGHPSAQAV